MLLQFLDLQAGLSKVLEGFALTPRQRDELLHVRDSLEDAISHLKAVPGRSPAYKPVVQARRRAG